MTRQPHTNVLMATLGEHPAVVSTTANLLRHQGINLDIVQIIYPDEPDDRWVGIGSGMLVDYFAQYPELRTELVPLPFADASSAESIRQFLQTVGSYLEQHEQAGNTVYLSLAGGRKHTSALLAILTQFFSCIQHVYHLHDTEEHNERKRFSVQQLDRMSPNERMRRLNLPTPHELERQRFTLIELPFTTLTNGIALWQWLEYAERDEIPPPIAIAPEDEAFFDHLFRPAKDTTRLDMWLTQTAYEQYCTLSKSSEKQLQVIDTYLKDMIRAEWHHIHGRIHDQQTDPNPEHVQEASNTPLNHFTCKKKRTAERVFYYTQPNAITGYPGQTVERLVITRFSWHITDKKYDIELADWVQRPDIVPRYRLNDLPKRPMVLIAPLGESPMVVTQTYRLLQECERAEMKAIWIVYPGSHAPACNGARMLEAVCQQRKVLFYPHALDIADVNSTETANKFAVGMMQAISQCQQKHPDASIALSISGGRKGMSVLTLYAAQQKGIQHVYHTIIRDPERERAIQVSYENVLHRSAATQAELMFLDTMVLSDFDLISVPVIALAVGS